MKKYKIVFDLDGVLRDLNFHLCKVFNSSYPTKWNWKYEKNKGICETIESNLKVLLNSPPTEYLKVVKKYFNNIEIWSYQSGKWKEYTLKWIKKYIGKNNYKIHFLSPEEKRKRLDKNKNYILIEDYPLFSNYNRIILIDRPYNQNVKKVERIKTINQLEKIIKKYKG